MDVIPAIDLRNGKCVRLRKGDDRRVTEYSDDPVAVARGWVEQGAKRLHIVNLDGAFGRLSHNVSIVGEIVRSVSAVIQLGGGLRSLADIESAFSIGCTKVVLGTIALEKPELIRDLVVRFGHDRIIVALDALNGMVATKGWRAVSNVRIADFAGSMKEMGVREVVYTDIERDGMMSGPDLSTVKELALMGLDVIASGGIASRDDVLALFSLRNPRITGVIIGKALYENVINFPQLLRELSTC